MPPRAKPETPTTEEYRPRSSQPESRGRPALLAAFPRQALVPLPASGAPVGRAWLAEVGLQDAKVSGSHLGLTREGGRLLIQDLGSRNGTWVGGRRLPPNERVRIQDGAVVRVGGTLMVYREAYTGPEAPAPPLGALVGPWGLGGVRAAVEALSGRPIRNVLLEGESGTGKELLAREVARALGRGERPFTAVNAAGVSAGVFEGQLFGWVRGAFSGSSGDNPGLLRAHAGGTVVLDEIGELPLELQPKLLRFLDSKEVLRVGATRPDLIDVALIAATNRPLEDAVQKGTFRLDLLARFPTRIHLPALRARSEDVFAIAEAYWRHLYGASSGAFPEADVEAIELLMLHDWPDNVRGVARVLAAVVPAIGLTEAVVRQVLPALRAASVTGRPTREAVLEALQACRGNQTKAAERLGLSRPQLLRLLKAMKDGGTGHQGDQNS